MKIHFEPPLHQYMDFFDQPAIFFAHGEDAHHQSDIPGRWRWEQWSSSSSKLLTVVLHPMEVSLLDLNFHNTNGPCWSHFRLAHFSVLPVFTCRQNIKSCSEVKEHCGCGLQVMRSSQLRLANGSVHWTSPVKQLLLGEVCQLLYGLFKSWPTSQ